MTRIFSEIEVAGAVFAGLLGLAFGSFLNVCLSRLPEGENIAWPGSHCRTCDHTLAWWENLPLLSWIILRGRCHTCRDWIGFRYPLVELAVGLCWAGCWLKFGPALFVLGDAPHQPAWGIVSLLGSLLLCWLLVALAALDAEYFWLPDWVTLPGIGLGFIFTLLQFRPGLEHPIFFLDGPQTLTQAAYWSGIGILAAAGLVLAIRLAYWLVRRKEGMGLGDAKLMAMLAAWLSLPAAFESFALAILGATAFAIVWFAFAAIRNRSQTSEGWAQIPLPLGTFLCLAALTQIFYPNWLWIAWSRIFLA
ncbi:prepilin peptidase [Acidicapsa ligni]|uniref:prepilin peptidase n=1 Tax=Acidicapsa ligni TaxID=542300 RepID=UPI0021E0717A|nr:A24 family peptidase [Acidicapsa ligni]